jgi:hypothetical protein
MCGFRDLPILSSGSSIASGGPICLPDASSTTYLTSTEGYGQHPLADGLPGRNATQHDASRQHRWTHTDPCVKSSKTGEEHCVFGDANFADGRGIAFVTTAERAAYMAAHPAFTTPDVTKGINQDLIRTTPAKYEVREVPGKGMGVIAKDYIRRGELIMANTASLMMDYRMFEEVSNADYQMLQAYAVDSLPAAHREAILGLSTQNAVNLTYRARVEQLASTNAFDIESSTTDDEQESGFYVVFPEIARMNHDCRPNADYYFDYDTMAQYIHALRDIGPGEELTLSYINPLERRKHRMARLERNWGFRCSCPLCTAEPAVAAASDARVRQIQTLLPQFKSYKPESRASPQLAELLISLYQQERLWGFMYEMYTYAALEYNGAGEPWLAVKYARLAVEWGITTAGEKDTDVKDMDKLAEDPWSHWSWMLRTQKRTGLGMKKQQQPQQADDDE